MADWRFPVTGDVDLSNCGELQDKLLVVVNTTNDDLLLDCTDLQFIDSTGVGVFMHTRQLLEIQGRGFRVENLNGMARRAIDVLGLTDLLEIPASESA